jgi:hypothetical protein
MERDHKIFDIIEREHQRQLHGIELIASENFVSEQVMEAMGFTLPTNMPKAIRGKGIMGVARLWTKVNRWPLKEPKNYSVLHGPTYNPIQVPRPTWRY